MRRRDLVWGASACFCLRPFNSLANSNAHGCIRSAAAGEMEMRRLIASSGEAKIDQICQAEITALNKHFGVNPAFGFYNDGTRKNAEADNRMYVKGHPDGTVLMGINFAKSLLEAGNVALVVVMAHEWCHIAQYKRKTKFIWNVRYELDADEGAGRYFGSKNADCKFGDIASRVFFDLGDTNFTLPGHHGTPSQRSDVFLDGFSCVAQ